MSETLTEIDVPPTQKLDVPGGQIAYRRHGEGRTTVFLHAAGGAGEWTAYHAALAAGRDLVVPEHPGFGRSDDLPRLRTIDDLVYHYWEVLDGLGVEQFDLVGSSFGGWIAAELAVHSPHRVGKLVLMAPAGLRVPGAPIGDLFLMTPPQLIRSLYHDEALQEAILGAPFDIDMVVASYRELGTLARFAWRPFLNNPRLPGRLHRIDSPTLVIAAGEDRLIPKQHAEAYADAIRGASLHVIENIGHALYGEDPLRAAEPVVAFLDA